MEQNHLTGLSTDELRSFVEHLGEKPYRGTQLFGWIHQKGAASFDEMTDISLSFREVLARTATVRTIHIVSSSVSSDGTRKFAVQLHDGAVVESVLIPMDDTNTRQTLCVSTQVGCPLDCAFCATGTMGFRRNLTAGEILEQYLIARAETKARISNVVYMGMGEPMLNYDNVMRSADILMDDHGAGIGARHITVSTAGYADHIRRMADEERRVRLALSLHSLNEEKRRKLMPITRKFGIAQLTAAVDYYTQRTGQRLTVEYIPFAGFNDSDEDVRLLAAFARRVPLKVNLIPFHTIDFTHPTGFAATLVPADRDRIEAFAARLRDQYVTTMIRSSSGLDINAACGQLAVTTTAERPGQRPIAVS